MNLLNETHDPALRSWVPGSTAAEGDFPIQNLPFGVFSTASTSARVGVAIGRSIVDVSKLLEHRLLTRSAAKAAAFCSDASLNALMASGEQALAELRLALSRLLRVDARERNAVANCLVPMELARLHLPVQPTGFTDFFTSINHANNASRVFDPNKPELPNFRSLPIAYNGRASTVVVSGTQCVRPKGQIKPRDAAHPIFAPTRLLDYELELGWYVGVGNELHHPIALTDAPHHVFGLSLVNDWSARDIQGWEMLPLGPFMGKSFMTSVSPWVITLEALAPFRTTAAARGDTSMPLLPYLHSDADRHLGGVDIELQVLISTASMRAAGLPPHCLGQPNFRDQYWTIFQMLAHHTSNGCCLRTGDLLASGTVSGATREQLGCLLELTEAGALPVQLPNGEQRRFLEDEDEVIMRGICRRDGFVSIGFGECRNRVVPAI